MLKYSFPMIPNSIAWWVMDASDRTIVSMYLGTSVNAILAIAHKMPNLCQTLFSVFHLSWQENAIETMNDKDRDQYYNKVMNNMIKILVPLCCVIISFNFIYFKVLFTDEYFPGYYQTPILICAIIFSMLANFIGGIYISNMESKKNGITTIITAIINIIVHLLLISKIGLYAASISTLCAYTILFIIRYIDVRRKIKLKVSKKSIILFCLLIYFSACQYANQTVLNVINVVLACTLFLFVNKDYIYKILRKVGVIE